jgi:hypothetical protein
VASVIALAPSLSQSRLVFAGVALLGQVALYGCLIRIFEPSADTKEGYMQRALPSLIRDVAYRAIGVLVLLAVAMSLVLLPASTVYVGKVVLVGILKATHWVFLFWIVGPSSPLYSRVHLLTFAGPRGALGHCANHMDLCSSVTWVFYFRWPYFFRNCTDLHSPGRRWLGYMPYD